MMLEPTRFFLLLALVVFPCVCADEQGGFPDQQGVPGIQCAGDNVNCATVFVIPDVTGDAPATFQCVDVAARCTIPGDFAVNDIQYNGGQEIANDKTDNPIMAFLNPDTDSLVIYGCDGPDCTVICNFGCTCELEGGIPCETGTLAPTPPPTPPPVEPPTTVQCKFTTNYEKGKCGELLDKAVNGTICDCYNFCGGQAVSCCDSVTRGGSCGALTCSEGEDKVQGCTEADRIGGPRTGDTTLPTGVTVNGDVAKNGDVESTNGSSSGTAVRASWVSFLVAFLTLVVWRI